MQVTMHGSNKGDLIAKIARFLESEDTSVKAAALKTLITLAEEGTLPANEIDRFTPFLERELADPESKLQVDATIAIFSLGKVSFAKVKHLFPETCRAIKEKNRFKLAPLMDFLARSSNVPDPLIASTIDDVIANGPSLFKEAHVKPALKAFFDTATSFNKKFIKVHRQAIEKALPSYDETMEEIAMLLRKKIGEHDAFIEAESKRKEKEARDRKRIEAERERRRMETERVAREAMQERDERDRPAMQETSEITDESPEVSGVPGETRLDHDDDAAQVDDRFTTFSSLGLRRRDPRDENGTKDDNV